MELIPIAYAYNGHREKFGIPRQSREESHIETRIVFEPAYRVREALRGIEKYSHLWLLWGFSEVVLPQDRSTLFGGMSPTVRPPRLGGNKRMGVWATRSPYRPNPIGLSSVRLVRIEDSKDGPVLVVTGADVMNGTPIYDIKPYLSFSDSHPDARNGFAEQTRDYRLRVTWEEESRATAEKAHLLIEIEEILSQDPRPAYQADAERLYKLDYAGYTIAFKKTDDACIHVVRISIISPVD